jgi:hypothetical protein
MTCVATVTYNGTKESISSICPTAASSSTTCPETVGKVNYGLLDRWFDKNQPDGASVKGDEYPQFRMDSPMYVMYSQVNMRERFGTPGDWWGQPYHFVWVQYRNAGDATDMAAGLGGWSFFEAYGPTSKQALKPFTPSSYDVLVAKADPARLVDVAKRNKGQTDGQDGSLAVSGFEVLRGGAPTVVHGITAGFREGSLDLVPFCWKDSATNRPRVCIRGTSFLVDCEAARYASLRRQWSGPGQKGWLVGPGQKGCRTVDFCPFFI